MNGDSSKRITIIGAGFTGLAAAYDLARAGFKVTVLEQDEEIGGLAGGFKVNNTWLEKFYHHWFTSDEHITALIRELGASDNIVPRATRTGMYYHRSLFKLSTPWDLLRFTPLSLVNRLRLGRLVLKARTVKDWHQLEHLTAEEWLVRMGGREVYKTVWEPLLIGKFGSLASEISAVWFWNKLKLRGGSRGRDGEEVLNYFRGGFLTLARMIAQDIRHHGGEIRTSTAVQEISAESQQVTGVITHTGRIASDVVVATFALPIAVDLFAPHVSEDYLTELKRIKYLANICLVLQLDRSLSDIYWLNVNDPNFPFVGIVEHTNFEPAASYDGHHIVYLSKYLPETDALFLMDDAALLRFSIPHIKRMFPAFNESWISDYHVWRARYAQPVVERNYSALIPTVDTPIKGLYLSTMAQVYPEDRGTNYAVREGRKVAKIVADSCLSVG